MQVFEFMRHSGFLPLCLGKSFVVVSVGFLPVRFLLCCPFDKTQIWLGICVFPCVFGGLCFGFYDLPSCMRPPVSM